jgi:hypothetical protein
MQIVEHTLRMPNSDNKMAEYILARKRRKASRMDIFGNCLTFETDWKVLENQ